MENYAPQKLTEGLVKRLPFNGQAYFVRDLAVTGLLVAVNKSSKSYKVQRDLWRGQRGRRRLIKTVRHTLGTIDELTLDDARTRAQEVIAQIKRGVDPNEPEPTETAGTWTLAQLWDEYASDMRKRELVPRTVSDFEMHLRDHLSDWKDTRINEIKRSMCRERHEEITEDHGPYPANQVLRSLRAAYNFALKTVDDPDALPDNPVRAVTFNKERRRDAVILPDDLPEWWKRAHTLPSAMRRDMHILGLLSGLRPGTLVSLRREWVRLKDRAISIPKMKAGRPFDLPLSAQMVEIVQRLLALGDIMYPSAPWLFPTRSTKNKEVIATQVWKEALLPSETGHILRHTYRTLAHAAGVQTTDVQLLMDHKVPGVTGVYLHDRALFTHLLAQQERVSAYILGLAAPEGP
jgi:integrase